MGRFTDKLEDSRGNTHHVWTNSNGTKEIYANDSICKGWGTKETSPCDKLTDAIQVLEAHTGAKVTGVRKV